MPIGPGDHSGRWFVIASPTGSGVVPPVGEGGPVFHNIITGSNWTSSAKLQQIADSSPFPSPWGTVGNYPTNSRFVPTFYVKNVEATSDPINFFVYEDSSSLTQVFSVPQNLQLVNFPGIATGSYAPGYGGKLAVTGSVPGIVGNTNTGSIGLTTAVPASPSSWSNIVSMSIAPNSFNQVNFSTFLNGNLDADYQIIYRDLESQQEAVYNVLSYDSFASGLSGITSLRVQYVSHTGGANPILNNSASLTFIDEASNQKTFIIASAANPRGDQPYANQFTVGSVGSEYGDYRTGIIKFFATESNNTADWTSLLKTVTSDSNGNNVWDNATYYGKTHNIMCFTGSAGVSSSYYLIFPFSES